WLTWSLRYPVGEHTVVLPLVGSEGDHPRDPEAERSLVASLDVLDAVPGLRTRVGTEQRLVPEARLEGIDTAAFVEAVLPVLTERDDVELSIEGQPLPYNETDEAPLIAVSAHDRVGPGGDPRDDWFDLGITVSVAGEDV